MFTFVNEEFDSLRRLASFVYFVSNGGWQYEAGLSGAFSSQECRFEFPLDECYLWDLKVKVESPGHWAVDSPYAVNEGLCVFMEVVSTVELLTITPDTVVTEETLKWGAALGRDETNLWQQALVRFLEQGGTTTIESLPHSVWLVRTELEGRRTETEVDLFELSDYFVEHLDSK
jgi:hypothetical protein